MRGDFLDRSTDSENRVSRHQDNNVGVVVASMCHRHASSNSKDVSDVASCEVKGLQMQIKGAFCD